MGYWVYYVLNVKRRRFHKYMQWTHNKRPVHVFSGVHAFDAILQAGLQVIPLRDGNLLVLQWETY